MTDSGFLAWPFFDDGHRDLAAEFERWAGEVLPAPLVDANDDLELDATYANSSVAHL